MKSICTQGRFADDLTIQSDICLPALRQTLSAADSQPDITFACKLHDFAALYVEMLNREELVYFGRRGM
jgi:hypothetical protein